MSVRKRSKRTKNVCPASILTPAPPCCGPSSRLHPNGLPKQDRGPYTYTNDELDTRYQLAFNTTDPIGSYIRMARIAGFGHENACVQCGAYCLIEHQYEDARDWFLRVPIYKHGDEHTILPWDGGLLFSASLVWTVEELVNYHDKCVQVDGESVHTDTTLHGTALNFCICNKWERAHDCLRKHLYSEQTLFAQNDKLMRLFYRCGVEAWNKGDRKCAANCWRELSQLSELSGLSNEVVVCATLSLASRVYCHPKNKQRALKLCTQALKMTDHEVLQIRAKKIMKAVQSEGTKVYRYSLANVPNIL